VRRVLSGGLFAMPKDSPPMGWEWGAGRVVDKRLLSFLTLLRNSGASVQFFDRSDNTIQLTKPVGVSYALRHFGAGQRYYQEEPKVVMVTHLSPMERFELAGNPEPPADHKGTLWCCLKEGTTRLESWYVSACIEQVVRMLEKEDMPMLLAMGNHWVKASIAAAVLDLGFDPWAI
jgi:hypothetical protein